LHWNRLLKFSRSTSGIDQTHVPVPQLLHAYSEH
jgi:hypothetical protein